MEVITESKQVHLSPTLITVLATLWIWSIALPSKAEDNALVRDANQIVVADGAALLRNIKPTAIAQNQNTAPEIPTPDASEDGGGNNQPGDSQTPEQQQPGRAPETTPRTSNEPRVLVAEVAVEGVNEELEDIVYTTISTEPGRTTTRTQLQEDVNAVYATGFFQNVEVSPSDTPLGVRITFEVQSNPILNNVSVITVPERKDSEILPAAKITEFFGNNYGQVLNLRDLQQGIIKVNDWYKNNGYELAQVVGSPQVSPRGEVTLVVAEGLIEDVQVRYFDEEDEPVEGKTREFIVTREVELSPGDVFKRDIAQKDLQRVFGLGIFDDARFSFSPGSDPSKVVVNIDVVEGSSGSIAAGAGFSSDSGLFGTVSYQQKNVGGNNQTLGTEVQVGDDSLLFDVSFTDPWIGTSKSRTSYTVNAFRRRSISLVFNGDDDIDTFMDDNDDGVNDDPDAPRIVRTGAGINFARPIQTDPFAKRNWTLSTGFQYQRVEVRDDDGDIVSKGILEDDPNATPIELSAGGDGTDDILSLRFNATRDRRNSALQPTKGSLLRLGTEQTIPIGGILYNRLRVNFSQYYPFDLLPFGGDTEALAFNFQAGTVLGDLPPYESFILGGSNSVRGFGDGEVGSGRSFFQATAEYRFPIFKIVGGALFIDYGSTLGSADNVIGEPSEVRDLPGSGFGYGVGVRVQSPLGPIRIDYAFNDEGDNEIQFGIGEKF